MLDGKCDQETTTFIKILISGDFTVESLYLNKDHYVMFLSIIGKHVVKDKHFKSLLANGRNNNDVNDWFTPQDEAISFVIFENGVARWIDEFKFKLVATDNCASAVQKCDIEKTDRKQFTPHRYTEKLIGGRTVKTGWDLLGMKRYRDLLRGCKLFRATESFVQFSEYVIESLQNPTLSQAHRRKENLLEAQEEYDRAKEMRELFDDPDLQIQFIRGQPQPSNSNQPQPRPSNLIPSQQLQTLPLGDPIPEPPQLRNTFPLLDNTGQTVEHLQQQPISHPGAPPLRQSNYVGPTQHQTSPQMPQLVQPSPGRVGNELELDNNFSQRSHNTLL